MQYIFTVGYGYTALYFCRRQKLNITVAGRTYNFNWPTGIIYNLDQTTLLLAVEV